ncbi:MAG: glycosyltransferase family 1 protein [Candidatus Moraniibacteriota bacterium]
MLKIGIDVSFLRKQDTGIGQVTVNFLNKLTEFPISSFQLPNKEKIEFYLYLEKDVKLKLPKNTAASAIKFYKRVFLPLYKRDDLIRKIWWEKYLLPKKVKQDGCDVFLSLYQSTTILPKRVKHLMLVHDIIPKIFPQYLNNFRKKLYQELVEDAIRAAAKIVTVSHRSEKDLIKHLGIDPKKITVSYIDVAEIYKKKVSQAENARVLKKYKLEAGYIYSGGGLEVRKNIESVVRAYKLLLEKSSADKKIPKLVISGRLLPQLAPLVTDIEKLVSQLDLKKQVVVLGWVPQADLPALYNSASLFVYPSLYEGFGLPILEAMSQATAVITAKTSSLPEIGSDSVLYCNSGDIEDIAMVMKNVLSNSHLKIALSLKGKERAAHFSWKKFTQKMINIIDELK